MYQRNNLHKPGGGLTQDSLDVLRPLIDIEKLSSTKSVCESVMQLSQVIEDLDTETHIAKSRSISIELPQPYHLNPCDILVAHL
jgi:hypothetical protein